MIAASENNALGKNNELVWLTQRFQKVQNLTSGHISLKNIRKFSKPLPNRTHIV
jgi:dihydrofolate reductase